LQLEWGEQKCIHNFGGRAVGKRPLGYLRRRWWFTSK